MKKLQILLLSLLTVSLAGCGYEKEKNLLQSTLDLYNTSGKEAICVYTHANKKIDLTLPYLTDPEDDNVRYDTGPFSGLNLRLSVFAELGLLQQDDLGNNHYRYTITDLGKSYVSKKGYSFCFGRIVVDDIKYEKKIKGVGLLHYTYSYHIEGIPEWVLDAKLLKINPNISQQPLTGSTITGAWIMFTNDGEIARNQLVGSQFY